MKKERIEEGRFTERSHGLGTVTEAMVRRRARQIAEINGRPSHQVLDSDVDQARRELTGEERLVPEATAEEQLPESDRWKEVAESEGRRAPTTITPDEQTFAEELVEEGVEDAEQDQMLESLAGVERKTRKLENERTGKRKDKLMNECEVCGNEYDKPLEIVVTGISHYFDCFECAIHALAPECEHCGCKIVGHGVESGGSIFCCAHCAHAEGVMAIHDRA